MFRLHPRETLLDKYKDFKIITSQASSSEDLLNRLTKATEGFGGSEIEQVVVSALFEAFSENRTLQESDLFKVIENTVPLSTTQAEQILTIREWANERAVAATAHDENYNYVPEETAESVKKKELAKKTTETIKRTRGGRTIDF